MKRLRRIARWLLMPIAKNRTFFVTMYILGVLCAVLTLPETRSAKLYDNLFLELFVDIYFVCVVLAIFPRHIRSWIRMLLYAVLYAVAIVDVYCFWKFGSTLNPTMLLLVSETDSREAGEFLQTYLSSDVLFSPLFWIFLLMLLHLAWKSRHTILRFLDPRQGLLIRGKLRRFAVRLRQQRIDVLGGMLVLVLLVFGIIDSWQNKRQMTRMMTAPTIGNVEHLLTEKDHAEFYLPIYRLAFSVYSNMLAAKQIDRCIIAAERAKVDSCSYRSPNIVFIIGESYSKAHSQLYGYRLKTAPHQLLLEDKGLLTSFTDVVSGWNLTSFVFKLFLSMYVIGDKGEWCDYPLFPELFRKAGYKVTFMTNQFLPKAQEAVYDFSGGFFLNDPTLNKAQFDTRNTELHRYDDGLLNDYDNFLKKGTINLKGHNLIIFHLIGQHVSYRTRYPSDRQVFKADDYKEARPELGPRARQMIADYDNAVLYNDSIVDQIVQRFENENAIVIYMPDHGEEIYEPGRHFIGRNHSSAVDWPLAHYEFEVPFWIYCSHSYAVKHPEVFKMIKDAKDKRFMTDALPHLMVWLAGIHTKDYRAKFNILSPDYDELRPRILKNSVDYDKLREAAMKKQ
ncbi:MAG: phosphoethanolamine transferase [Bacteroidota bacterium]|nr:phosphoethanolamine transferase [Bacteroidota bacterium]